MPATKKVAQAFTASQLEDRLAARYRTDASEILFGVRNDAGFSANRSTGCALEGFKIKVSRGDWLRELREGAKSEAFMVHMDFWWLVAPREVVTDDELPPAWGMLTPHGDGLRVARQAKRNESPLPMPRGMLAALVKRASTQQARKAALDERYRAGVDDGKRSATSTASWEAQQYRELQERVTDFAAETGINIRHLYDAKALGKAYALVKRGGHLDLARRLGAAVTNIEGLATELRATVASIAEGEEAGA